MQAACRDVELQNKNLVPWRQLRVGPAEQKRGSAGQHSLFLAGWMAAPSKVTA